MTGKRLRRAAGAASLGLGAALVSTVAVAIASGGRQIPAWSVPPVAVVALVACELAELARATVPAASVERPALVRLVTGRLLVVAALAASAATLALLAAAVPAHHGFASGLVGVAAAAALFLLVGVIGGKQPRAHDG